MNYSIQALARYYFSYGKTNIEREKIMAKILVIKSSIMGEAGNSNALVDQFTTQWRENKGDGGDTVIVRDFSKNPIPHLSQQRFIAFVTPEDERSEQQKNETVLSDELVAEFLTADVIILGVPMYNFGIPSTLKAYIDHLARVGKTFRYTEKGPVGLAENKQVFVLGARGGIYAGTPNDTQTPYLKSIFGLLGVDDITFVVAEGLNISPEQKEKSMSQAKQQIESLLN